jgi:cyclopropane-fatty-acyl-phospholipid synthase
MLANLERRLFEKLLRRLEGGELTLRERGRATQYGAPGDDGLKAAIDVRDAGFYRQAIFGGEIGMGEAYMDGRWSSPDLVSLVRLGVRNAARLDAHGWLRWIDRLRHLWRDNTVAGSRENIRRHYDLSNDFFGLWLDPTMMYSAALWERGDETLSEAQTQKLDRACRQIDLREGDHLLEVGAGWGTLAIHAAQSFGCRVTTTTISREQYEMAQERIAAAGLRGRVELLLEDYRELRGKFDKAVSIEMFEAVGFKHYDAFFGKLQSLLRPGAPFLLQTITMNERQFPRYIEGTDWIQKYIFPGGELSSVAEIEKSLKRTGPYRLMERREFGLDYARTLREWRAAFRAQLERVRELGFDERFCRMWDYYLAYCEGAFLEGYIGVSQLRFGYGGGRAVAL